MKPFSAEIQLELHVPDFIPIKEFYGAFGFVIVQEDQGSGKDAYLIMRRDNAVIRFWPGNSSVEQHSYFQQFPRHTPRGFGVEIVLSIEDIDHAYAVARERGIVVQDIKAKSWGLRDFRMIDPFGYYIRVTEPHRSA